MIVFATGSQVLVSVGVAAGVAVAVVRSQAPSYDLEEPEPAEKQVFISASVLEAMMSEPGSVTLLDARPRNPSAALLDPAWSRTILGAAIVHIYV